MRALVRVYAFALIGMFREGTLQTLLCDGYHQYQKHGVLGRPDLYWISHSFKSDKTKAAVLESPLTMLGRCEGFLDVKKRRRKFAGLVIKGFCKMFSASDC